MSTPPLSTYDATATRLILTRVADITLAFPSAWVSEIFQADRKQVLPMPFYGALVLGVLHHNSQVVSLVLGDRLFGYPATALKETLTVIQLSQAAGELAGVGIIVEQLLGSKQASEIKLDSFPNCHTPPEKDQTILFAASLIPETLWQTQRWRLSS